MPADRKQHIRISIVAYFICAGKACVMQFVMQIQFEVKWIYLPSYLARLQQKRNFFVHTTHHFKLTISRKTMFWHLVCFIVITVIPVFQFSDEREQYW